MENDPLLAKQKVEDKKDEKDEWRLGYNESANDFQPFSVKWGFVDPTTVQFERTSTNRSMFAAGGVRPRRSSRIEPDN